jgi:hypothetical protein
VLRIRESADFETKIKFCDTCKKKGNASFAEEDFSAAIVEYERALSVWDWVESALADWKRNVRDFLFS